MIICSQSSKQQSRIKQNYPKSHKHTCPIDQASDNNYLFMQANKFQVDNMIKNFQQKINLICNSPNRIEQQTSYFKQLQQNQSEQKQQLQNQSHTQRSEQCNQNNSNFNEAKSQQNAKNKQLYNNNSDTFPDATKLKQPYKLLISDLADLQTSIRKQNMKNQHDKGTFQSQKSLKIKQFDQRSALKSSRIVTKMNQMQYFYTSKIKQLSVRNSYLQNQNQHLLSQNKNLMESVVIFKQIAQRKKQDMDLQMEQKMFQIKQDLIQRFSTEARDRYKTYIQQIKKINDNLSQERKKRTYFENQSKVLKIQKENIESMYKQILTNHKNLIRHQIDQAQFQIHSQQNSEIEKLSQYRLYDQYHPNQIKDQNVGSSQNQQQQKIDQLSGIIYNSRKMHSNFNKDNQSANNNKKTSKSQDKSLNYSKQKHNKQKKKKNRQKTSTNKSHKKSNVQMSRQQLIPFLAQGIQELKDKLKIK